MNLPIYHLQALKAILIPAANIVNAAAMGNYMKNKFPFLGIKKPEREKLTKEWIKISSQQYGNQYVSLVKSLWELSEREYQYVALVMLAKSKKYWDDQLITLCENLITQKSWWDTVDILATKILGNYFLLHPDQLETKVMKWAASDNLWL
jgi:3-methyladenine DNA glycosylase AlkD